MSTSVVCIDTVGSYTATVIIRIQEVTNVRVLPPFSVFPRWPDDVGVVRRGGRECIRAPDTAAEAARVNGAVRARVGRAQLPAAPSATGRSRPGRAWAGRPSALAARACMWHTSCGRAVARRRSTRPAPPSSVKLRSHLVWSRCINSFDPFLFSTRAKYLTSVAHVLTYDNAAAHERPYNLGSPPRRFELRSYCIVSSLLRVGIVLADLGVDFGHF